MRGKQTITALDIGTTKICVLIAVTTDEDKYEVKGIGISKSEGISNGQVTDIMKTAKSIQKALKEAEEMAGTKPKNIYVGIAGDHIKSQNTMGRISLTSGTDACEITSEHVENVLSNSKNNVKLQPGNDRLEIIHAIPQYFDIDEMKGIMNPLRMSGFNLTAHVHIVMADKTALTNIRKCVEICGHKVNDIFLEPIASSYSVLNEVEKNLGSILIDIGGGTTDIAVFYKDSIRFSAVLPIGGTNITQDLAIGLHTSPFNAEELKISLGNAIAQQLPDDKYVEISGISGRESKKKKLRYISEIIEARMREILETAYRLLNDEYNLAMITAGLTMTGGASLLKNSEHLAREIFNMSAKIGYPDLSLLSGATDRLESPKFATAVGILYQAFQEELEADIVSNTIAKPDAFTAMIKKVLNNFKEYF